MSPRKAKPALITQHYDAMTLYLSEPPSANKWWRRSGTHMHLSNEAREYKQSVLLYAIAQRFMMIPKAHAIRVEINWWRARKSGDLDKRIPIVLDAMQGTCYENDSQITELSARRFDVKGAAHPLVVRICPLHKPA